MKLLFILLFSAMTALAQTPEWSRKYHTGSVNCLDFSKDGNRLLTGSSDGKVMLWNTKLGDTTKTFKKFNAEVLSLSYNSTDEWFVVSPREYSHYILSENADTVLKTLKLSQTLFFDGHFIIELSIPYTSISYVYKNDKQIYIQTGGGVQQFFEGAYGGGEAGKDGTYYIDSNKLVESQSSYGYKYDVFKKSQDQKYQASIAHNSFGPSSQHRKNNYLRNSYSFNCSLGQSFYGENEYQADKLGKNRITNLGFTGDSKYVLSYNRGGTVHIRSINDNKIIDSLGSPIGGVIELSGDMRGKYYITVHSDSTLRIWTRGMHNIFKKIKLSSNITQSAVSTIAFSPDYFHFATAHNDGTVAYWDMDYIAKYAVTDSVFTPSISAITENKTLCKGENAEFQVTAQSNFGEELFYQWQKGGVDLVESDSVSGVTSLKLLLKNIDISDAGAYSVKVTSFSKPQSISAAVSLAVKNIPVFKKPIVSQYSYTGQNYTPIILFHAELTDSVYAQYQWFKNGVEIPNATKSQYYFERKDSALHVGEYTVRVTNQCGNIVSNSVIIKEIINSVEENPFKTTTLSAEPNPFKNSTTIRFSLPKPLKIKLTVTDILGREVAVLKDELVESGEQNVVFKNDALPDGAYFVTISGDGLLKTIPVQIIR